MAGEINQRNPIVNFWCASLGYRDKAVQPRMRRRSQGARGLQAASRHEWCERFDWPACWRTLKRRQRRAPGQRHRARVRPMTPATAITPPATPRLVMRSPSTHHVSGISSNGEVADDGQDNAGLLRDQRPLKTSHTEGRPGQGGGRHPRPTRRPVRPADGPVPMVIFR